jgi:hypothetical protein
MSIIPENSPVPETKSKAPIQATMPTPGGPQGEPVSVRDTLMKELAEAGQTARQTSQGLGVQRDEPRNVIPPKGILIGGKQVAQAELSESMFAQQKAIDEYIRQAGYTNVYDAGIAKSYMNDRLNNVRTKLLKIANDFKKKLAQEKIDQEKKSMLAKNLGTIAGAIAGGIIGGVAGAAIGSQAGGALGGAVGGQ